LDSRTKAWAVAVKVEGKRPMRRDHDRGSWSSVFRATVLISPNACSIRIANTWADGIAALPDRPLVNRSATAAGVLQHAASRPSNAAR
jgi:hypothetical protein